MQEPTVKDLKEVGKELNKFLSTDGQGEAINIGTKATKKTLTKQLMEAFEVLEPETDEVSVFALGVLESIGCDVSKFQDEPVEEEAEAEEEEAPELSGSDKADLSKVAKELNTVLKLSEPIDLKSSVTELTEEIVEVCSDIEDGEFEAKVFSDKAHNLFKVLGIEIKWAEFKEEKKAKEKSKPKKQSKSSSTQEMMVEVELLLKKGKYTRKEIIEKVSKKIPDLKLTSIGTVVSDAKNPKYNKFDKLVKQNEKGILSFA